MARKKRNQNNNNKSYNEYEDARDMNRGGQRKSKRKRKRYSEKKHLDGVMNGEIDPDAYEDFMDGG